MARPCTPSSVTTSTHSAPNLSLLMASAVPPPRQLELTVGQKQVLDGVFIRTGNIIAKTGERVYSGLIQNFVSDNTGCFGTKTFPRGGRFIKFGEHQVYVAVRVERAYPERVVLAPDPPAIPVTGKLHQLVSMEVMMTSPNPAAPPIVPVVNENAEGGNHEEMPRAARKTKAPLEKPENIARSKRAKELQEAMDKLAEPVAQATDPARVQTELEEARIKVLEKAKELVQLQQDVDITIRELNLANRVKGAKTRLDATRLRERNLNEELADATSKIRPENSNKTAMRPTYNTAAANLRAAEAAMAELPYLEGEAKKRQQERVNELVRAASMLNEAYYRAKPCIAGRSQLVHLATPVPA